MKFLVKSEQNVSLYCTKGDIIALMSSDNPPEDDIINAVIGLKADDYVKFENRLQVRYLNSHPWLISYAGIKSHQNRIQTYIDRLYSHLAFLAYYEDEYNDSMSEKLRHKREQLEQECQYQIYSLESFDRALDNLPIVPNKKWLELECDEYAMYGTYFDNILYIEHKHHEPISLEDQIPYTFIKDGVANAVSTNDVYTDKENYQYEIIPDFIENKWFILIKPIINENKKRKFFAKKEETKKK